MWILPPNSSWGWMQACFALACPWVIVLPPDFHPAQQSRLDHNLPGQIAYSIKTQKPTEWYIIPSRASGLQSHLRTTYQRGEPPAFKAQRSRTASGQVKVMRHQD